MRIGNPESSLYMESMGWLDLEFARQLRNHPDVRSWLAQQESISLLQQVKWYRKLLKDKSKDRLIIYYNQLPIGVVRLDNIDLKNKSICIGMDIHPLFRGQGLGQQAYQMLFKYFFNKNFNRIWLLVGSYNDRGIHLYQKIGMTIEGVQRQALYRDNHFYDYILMSILRGEYETNKLIQS